jgi:hypothetical protein
MITCDKDRELIPFSPIEFLEMSVIACLLSSIQERKINLRQIKVLISNNKVRIDIDCENCDITKITEIISNCYVLKHLDFEKILKIGDKK